MNKRRRQPSQPLAAVGPGDDLRASRRAELTGLAQVLVHHEPETLDELAEPVIALVDAIVFAQRP